MKDKYFIPSHLKNLGGRFVGMTSLAPRFFKIGNELLEMARKSVTKKSDGSGFDHSHYCFPSIIMFCTSFEAFINETLEHSKYITQKDGKENCLEILSTIEKIKKKNRIKNKIKSFYKAYDKSFNGIDINGDLCQSLLALFKLRNEIIHYSPEMDEIKKWPVRLKEAFLKSNPKIKENTCWTSAFNSVTVGEWAHDTIKNAIREFSKISGADDPFDEKVPYPWHWERSK